MKIYEKENIFKRNMETKIDNNSYLFKGNK